MRYYVDADGSQTRSVRFAGRWARSRLAELRCALSSGGQVDRITQGARAFSIFSRVFRSSAILANYPLLTWASTVLAVIVAAYAETFRRLTQSIQALEGELAEREQRDARAARLQTMPRVGRISSLTFLA